MAQYESDTEVIREIIERSGFNVTLRVLMNIANQKSLSSRNWNEDNKLRWSYLAKIVKKASDEIEDLRAVDLSLQEMGA